MAGHDEYETPKRSFTLEPFIIPIVILIVAVAVASSIMGMGGSTHEVVATLKTLAANNHILQAFIASSVLGVISYTVVTTGRTVLSWLRGRTFCSITISNKDESFLKIIDFVGKQGIVTSGCLVASTFKKKKTWKDWRTEFLMGQRAPPKMQYQPANNNDVHVIRYAGARILMHRAKGETVVAGWERQPVQMETLTLSSFGSRVAPLKALIDDALRASFEEQQDELSVFVLNDMWGGSWEKALSKKPRSIDSVILDEDLAANLLADARDFLHASEWYASVGIPYRRGYLLHGPPGCGKTSFCQALAGALKLDVCMLTLSNKNLDDNGLAESLRDAPSNAIVLLEDVDAVFVDRSLQTESGGRGAGVTFSGLLNALDGVASQEGRLFFMTTNHIEKLDPALIRPGRCDLKVEVRRASRAQARRLFTRFFPDEPEEHAVSFAESLPEYELSMAALQGHLLEHKTDAAGALAHVPKLLRADAPLHVDRMPVFNHLRRVGLEGWSRLFEYHGHQLKAELRGLSIGTVKAWSGYLRIDAKACKRMELLLAENDALMKEYQLVDMATAKDLFLAAFANEEEQAADEASDADTDLAEEEEAAAAKSAPRKPLSKLADELCRALQIDGKAAASIWQLRHHLHLYAHSAAEAVAAAGRLVEPSPPSGCDALDIDELGTYDFLRRAGLEAHAARLEEEGYTTARSLYGLSEGTLKEKAGITDAQQLKHLEALLGAKEEAARTLLAFTSPDFARLRRAFLDGFESDPALTEAHATAFATALTDGAGHGKISLHQLEAYLASMTGKGAAAAAAAATAELIDHVRPPASPKPEKPPPTEWVYAWLKEHKLEGYAPKFLEANFAERDDLVLEPRLELKDLEKLGVDKAADARKILNLIKRLDATEASLGGGKGSPLSVTPPAEVSP